MPRGIREQFGYCGIALTTEDLRRQLIYPMEYVHYYSVVIDFVNCWYCCNNLRQESKLGRFIGILEPYISAR